MHADAEPSFPSLRSVPNRVRLAGPRSSAGASSWRSLLRRTDLWGASGGSSTSSASPTWKRRPSEQLRRRGSARVSADFVTVVGEPLSSLDVSPPDATRCADCGLLRTANPWACLRGLPGHPRPARSYRGGFRQRGCRPDSPPQPASCRSRRELGHQFVPRTSAARGARTRSRRGRDPTPPTPPCRSRCA